MKFRKFALVIAALALGFSSLACGFTANLSGVRGSGNIAGELRSLEGFDRVYVTSGMHLIVEQGDQFVVNLEGDDNILSYILTEVSEDTLTIFYNTSQRRNFRPSRAVIIRVTMPQVEELNASGGSRIETGPLQGSELNLNVSGGGRATLESVSYERLYCELSGGSQATLAGEVRQQTVQGSGGSQYHAGDLHTVETNIHLSGGGLGLVWADESLDAGLSGGAQLGYYGSPRVSQDITGGSTVRSRGDK